VAAFIKENEMKNQRIISKWKLKHVFGVI